MTRCRSCGAEIRWAMTSKGKRIPLDVGEHADGNLVLHEDPMRIAATVAYGDGEAETLGIKGPRALSHFATCPQASQHRRAR